MVEKLKELSRAYAAIIVAIAYIVALFVAAIIPVKAEIYVDGQKQTVLAKHLVVRDVLKENRIALGSRDKVEPSLNSLISDSKNRITITRSSTIRVKYYGVVEEITLYGKNASRDLVKISNYKSDSVVALKPSRERPTYVVYFKKKKLREEKLVYFDNSGRILSRPDSKSALQLGVRKQVIEKIYFGHLLASERVISEKIVKKPLLARAPSKVFARNSRNNTASKSSPSSTADTNSNKALRMHSTAYAPGAGAGFITATGRKAAYGIAAVDPRVIPLGTRLYIPGYGYAIAADTGGAIKGYRIDLCFNTRDEAIRWGRRTVTVYILK